MKKTIVTIGIILVIIFLLALPKLNLFSNKQGSDASSAGAGPPRLPVEAVVVKAGRLDNKLIVTGSIMPNEQLELKSEVSGKITAIHFKEGKFVRKGELLVEINDDELFAQLEKQKYNQKLNEDNEFRQRKLLEKDAISQEEYDNALNRLNTTIADIKLLEAQLAKTKIRAPFDGTIGLRYVSEGAFINSNTVIATLYNLSPAKVEFAVPGRYSMQVRPGRKVFFTIENDSRVFQGNVYAVEPQIDPSTRTLRIRAIAENREGLLLPGQFVRVELILETVENALLVPTQSIIQEMEGARVFISKNGKASQVNVTTGTRTEREIEILSGLNAGDTLIITGLLQIREGLLLQFTKIE